MFQIGPALRSGRAFGHLLSGRAATLFRESFRQRPRCRLTRIAQLMDPKSGAPGKPGRCSPAAGDSVLPALASLGTAQSAVHRDPAPSLSVVDATTTPEDAKTFRSLDAGRSVRCAAEVIRMPGLTRSAGGRAWRARRNQDRWWCCHGLQQTAVQARTGSGGLIGSSR